LGFAGEHGASGGLFLRMSASAVPGASSLLPQAVDLFALREPLDRFEVDLGAVLLHDHADSLPGLVPQAELFQFAATGPAPVRCPS